MRNFNLIYHILIWVAGLILVYASDFLSVTYIDYREFTYFSLIFGTCVNALMFYVNGSVLLPLVLKRKINAGKYIILIILGVIFLTTVEGFADYLFNKLTNPFWDNITVELSIEYFDLTLLINFLFLVFSFGYGFTLQWYKNEILKRKLIQDNIQTELNMLKTQVKPHFLFNTLNNIFGLANKNGDKVVASSISKLADIMRYLTYETKQGKVELNQEIEYLHNYIDLQKLRFAKDDNIRIEFSVVGETEKVFIDQLILLPLVENAFKHGISLQNPSEILINLEVDDTELRFRVDNSLHKVKEIITKNDSGVGLENLKKRLELLYPEKYHLNIEDKKDKFKVTLTIRYE